MTERTLEGRSALVTGAGKRIGKAIALELARAGANIAVHVNSSLEEGRQTARESAAFGARTCVVTANQRDVEDVRGACNQAAQALGPISILVNCAAIWPQAALETISREDFDLALETNLRGPFFWARFLGPEMKKQGKGCIVNIADVSADRPLAEAIPYCMAKAGIVSMTYGLAKALAPEVRVNAIGPGPMLFPPDYPEEKKREELEATLLGREGGADAIAKAVRFLCEHDYITGTMLPVDGGFRFGI